MPLSKGGCRVTVRPDGKVDPVIESVHHGFELEEDGATWFKSAPTRHDEAQRARQHFEKIQAAVIQGQATGQCQEGKWTNNHLVFPDLGLLSPVGGPGVVPFPPNNRQLFTPKPLKTPGTEDDVSSTSASSSSSSDGRERGLHDADQRMATVPWTRLGSTVTAPVVFEEYKTHCGRVLQGGLDNGYFIEALNAISMRPKLVRQLFHHWDVQRAIYVLQLYMNGVWVRVEIDDYVPGSTWDDDGMLCCRSEHFPHVLWPSLVEKAYAKMHTIRTADSLNESGGWESLSGGGTVEEVLSDLTGGVCGRFSTRDVTPERIFVLFYTLQRDALFVCRPSQKRCKKFGMGFDSRSPHAVNRAVPFEDQCFVQIFCGGEVADSCGVQELSVPTELIRLFPERVKDGFYWLPIADFCLYFDTVFDCRLVNSPDVGIRGMPPSRLPMASYGSENWGDRPRPPAPPCPPFDTPALFFETVYATSGRINPNCVPEFTVQVPGNAVPCEIVCCVSQVDKRSMQIGRHREREEALLLKVYQQLEREIFSAHLVCRSNWIPVRDAMVAWKCNEGGTFKIVCEFEKDVAFNRLLFRCYSSQPFVQAAAHKSLHSHRLARPPWPSDAIKWTFTGCRAETRLSSRSEPEPYNSRTDRLRRHRRHKSRCLVQ